MVKIPMLDRYMEQIKREHEWAVGQLKLDEYLGHPLHAFRLIKRLVLDWDELIFETIIENKPREGGYNSFLSIAIKLNSFSQISVHLWML